MRPPPRTGAVCRWGDAVQRRGAESEKAVRGLMRWFGMGLEDAVDGAGAAGGGVRPAFMDVKRGPD